MKNGTTPRCKIDMDLYIGCTAKEFKAHIASQFRNGMNWNNRGKGPGHWQLDHIKSAHKFNQLEICEFFDCWHYTNFQPLWFEENSSKDLYDEHIEFIPREQ